MPDVYDSKTRSYVMSCIKGKDTKPELIVRSMLHREGYRFRVHVKSLPGSPDIVLKKHSIYGLFETCLSDHIRFMRGGTSDPKAFKEKYHVNIQYDGNGPMVLFQERASNLHKAMKVYAKENAIEYRYKYASQVGARIRSDLKTIMDIGFDVKIEQGSSNLKLYTISIRPDIDFFRKRASEIPVNWGSGC